MMKPIQFIEKQAFLLGGFHAGAEQPGVNHWEKFESQTAKEDLRNLVDDTGFEVRFYPETRENIFTGVRVKSADGQPSYEFLTVPAALYAVFDINCKKKLDSQFGGIDKWLDKNRAAFPRRQWDGADYIVCCYGRMAKERVFEMWIPVTKA